MDYGRYFLIIVNFITMFLGMSFLEILCIESIFNQSMLSGYYLDRYKQLIFSAVFIPVLIALIISSMIAFLIGFIGCLGALKKNSVLMNTYAILLVIILLIQINIGFGTFLFPEKIGDLYSRFYETKFLQYRGDKYIRNSIDQVQYDLIKCCGVDGPQDYSNYRMGSNGPIPTSCRSRTVNRFAGIPTINSEGCVTKIISEIVSHTPLITKIAFVIGTIEMMLIISALYLVDSVKELERSSPQIYSRFL